MTFFARVHRFKKNHFISTKKKKKKGDVKTRLFSRCTLNCFKLFNKLPSSLSASLWNIHCRGLQQKMIWEPYKRPKWHWIVYLGRRRWWWRREEVEHVGAAQTRDSRRNWREGNWRRKAEGGGGSFDRNISRVTFPTCHSAWREFMPYFWYRFCQTSGSPLTSTCR